MTVWGKVILVGFELEPIEQAIVQRTVQTYLKKIEEKINYQELKLRLKKSAHGKAFLHEIHGGLMAGKRIMNAEASGYNLYEALSGVFEKFLSEIEHKERTVRQGK